MTSASQSPCSDGAVSRVRRCQILFFEPRGELELDLANIGTGGRGVKRTLQWLAYAGHLGAAVPLAADEMLALSVIDDVDFTPIEVLEERHGATLVSHLITCGLLIEEGAINDDRKMHDIPWHPLAALYHMHGRWTDRSLRGTEFGESAKQAEFVSSGRDIPPPCRSRKSDRLDVIQLPECVPTALDELLSRRRTCRFFDPDATMSFAALAKILSRVFRIKDLRSLSNGLEIGHRTSPAGGGIHATECYIIVQRVEGLAPGIYRYDSVENDLELIRMTTEQSTHDLAQKILAGQHYFASAPVLMVMTSRFDRLYWKYRKHSKALKVSHLDAGHLSQTLYLTATEFGLGAFVSAAVNDAMIEVLLGLDPIREGVIAVAGVGSWIDRE